MNGGKIRIDLTYTKYKVLREVALEMQWKVVTAKKKEEKAENQPEHNKKGKETSNAQQQISKEEKERLHKEELARQGNVDIIWNDVTIPSEKLNQLKGF